MTDTRERMREIYARRDEIRAERDNPESVPTDDETEPMVEREMEAAGIEPASRSHPKNPISRDFSFTTTLADFEISVTDGQIFIYEPGGIGSSEPLSDTVEAKLEALGYAVGTVRAQEADNGTG
jgi:hypothetical protein